MEKLKGEAGARPALSRNCKGLVVVSTHLSQVARPVLRSHHTLEARRWNCIIECNPVMLY